MHLSHLAGLAAVAAFVLTSTTALAAGDAAKGEKVFAKCKICHMVSVDGKHTIGPNLHGVVGRKAGSTDFNYSSAMKGADIVWNAETLDKYLTDPKAMVPGNKMAFAGLTKASDRENVIAYLTEQSK